MVQPTYIAALQELKALPAPEDQLALLRLLKNDIIGHGQRKEHAVRQGILEPLAVILQSTNKINGKKTSASYTQPYAADQPSLEHEIRLQATIIVGSLANAGPAFVSPILASGLPQILLQTLDPSDLPPKVLVATLRSLNNLASAWASLVFASPNDDHVSFPDHVLSKPVVDAFVAVLQQPSSSYMVKQQVVLTADLINHCCVTDAARNLLVKEGVLDALADLLASFALSHASPLPHDSTPTFDTQFSVRHLLNTLSTIVEGSNYRAHRLLYSPSLRKALTNAKERTFYDDPQGPNFRQHRRPSDSLSVEHLLPKIMVQKPAPFGSHAFPALTLASSRLLAEQSIMDSPSSSPLCVWLVYLARSQAASSSRLAALRLLALVSNALDADTGNLRPDMIPKSRERERQIALLAVPVAVGLVKECAEATKTTMNPALVNTHDRNESTIVKTEACAVLARLIKNNVELQKAAHSAGAHSHVAQLLKRSFEPIALARPMWSPQSQSGGVQSLSSPTTTLGQGGLPQEVVNVLKARAGALEAVAAISEREDSIRKDLIEAGVAAYIIDSLTAFADDGSSFVSSSFQAKDGNTVPVILAACQAATAMSRSVGNLRTSLIDAGLGKPVFALLRHQDNAVQVAATDVSINLVLDFSPMREDLISAGVIQIFCMHAKRSSPKLRQVSLWGLKHLVLNAPQAIKHQCLEELGSGWLIQAINGDQLESHSSQHLGLSTPNAQGEQVDLLNAPDTPDMDIDVADNEDSDDEDEVSYDQNGTRYQSSGIRSTLEATNHKTRLRTFREQEFNTTFQAKQDDILIQEQALDFMRNLINGDDNVYMIDHLNTTIGANRIFDMLYNKLKPAIAPSAPMHGFSFSQRQTPTQSQAQSVNPIVQQPPELVRAALGVLIHLAAGSSRHRQQLVAQKQLLTAWLPHFNHPDRQIRVASVWGVINLTWPETASDREDARRRALELRTVGIEDKVRGLANDQDLDTRERVKTAIRQIEELLGGLGRQR